MKLTSIGEAVPVPKEQALVSQSAPGDFDLAMASVMALLNTPLPNTSPVNNESGTELAGDCFEPVSLPVFNTEAAVSGKQYVSLQEPGQAQTRPEVVTDGSIDSSAQTETGIVQPDSNGSPEEAGENPPMFTGILPLEKDYRPAQPLVTIPGANELTLTYLNHSLSQAELQVTIPGANELTNFGSVSVPAQTAVLTSAEGTVTNSDADGANKVAFTRLENPVTALRDPAMFEAALTVEGTPVFDTGSSAVTTAGEDTAGEAPDQVLKTVPAESPPAAGRVVAGREPAATSMVETSTSGEVEKSAGQENTVFTGKAKTPAASVNRNSVLLFDQATGEIVLAPGEKASGAAKTKVTSFGQEVSLLARTVNEATGADIPIPLFAQPDREPGAAPGQVYDMIQAALETTEAENTTFTKLAKPVVAELGYPALFEAAAAAEDAPAFDASIPAVTTVRAGTADVPDQVLKTVSADSQSATGQVVNSQELAAAPTGATSNSGAAVKSAEEEKAVSTGKTETSPAGTAVDTEAAKTGGKGAGGVVENTAPNNAPQYNPVSPMSSSSDNLKTVKLADMRDALVQEIERAYRQQKSDTWTQVDLKLEPEHLGKLTIKLFFNGGELNAHFYAGNDYVKDVLESSIQQLRQTLDQQDLKLNQAFVFVGDDGRSGTGQSESGGRQPAHYPRSYGGLTYGEIVAEAAAYEPGGNSYKIVNYLI